MSRVEFNYGSTEARAARQAKFLAVDGAVFMVGVLLAISLVAMIVIWTMDSEAWKLLAALASVFFIIRAYFGGRLKNLVGDIHDQSTPLRIERQLDVRTLAKLKAINSRRDLWDAVKGNWRQQFIMNRFMIEPAFIESHLPSGIEDTSDVWIAARELALAEGQPQITSASLTVALIQSIPGYEDYLASRHIEPLDLVAGVDWQRHIEASLAQAKDFRFRGGITRGSTGGYTPLLDKVARDLTYEISSPEFLYRSFDMHAAQVNQAIESMATARGSALAIIGGAGSGKESVVKALARQLYAGSNVPKSLRFARVYRINASDIIALSNSHVNAATIFNNVIAEAAKAGNIILHFNDAQDFFADSNASGKGDFSGLISTIVSRPPLPIILSINGRAWQQIRQRWTGLASSLVQINLPEPETSATLRVMEDQAPIIEAETGVTFTYQSIRESYRLAERYMTDLSFPGKGLRAMRAAAAHVGSGNLITEEIVRAAFETNFAVKLEASADDKSRLLNLEDLLRQRLVGQGRAVQVVSDALRRSASGLKQSNRLIGAFLFIGPTGVGKTELAKALAAAYFNGEEKVIRVDMNQFLSSSDLSRLIDPTAADSLISRIRRQPFSVVLLDEIEKAHPDIVNSLLQMLDEGTMQDNAGAAVSFRDSIVIATSNAGARQITTYITSSHDEPQTQESHVRNWLIEHSLFVPEFLNRFDEMILFRPLSREELRRVVDIQLANMNRELANQKVTIELTESAKDWVVKHGYDPALGARPLRRTLQRSVENVVSKKLLSTPSSGGKSFTLDVADLESA